MGTVGGKVGCGAALVAGLPVFALLMFMNFYGDCAGDPRCHEGEGLRFLIVLGSVSAVAAAAGFGVRFVVNKLGVLKSDREECPLWLWWFGWPALSNSDSIYLPTPGRPDAPDGRG